MRRPEARSSPDISRNALAPNGRRSPAAAPCPRGRRVQCLVGQIGGPEKSSRIAAAQSRGNNPLDEELFLDLVVGHQLTRIRLPKTFLNLHDEAQSLDRVLYRCVLRQCPQRLDGTLLSVISMFRILPSSV